MICDNYCTSWCHHCGCDYIAAIIIIKEYILNSYVSISHESLRLSLFLGHLYFISNQQLRISVFGRRDRDTDFFSYLWF